LPNPLKAEAESRVEQSLLDLVRRVTDPRGNASLKARSGIDLERAATVLLARIEELGPARLSDVALAAGVEISTASRPVTRLVEQGYVERSTDPADGRAALLRTTALGRAVLERWRAARREWLRDVLEDFDDEERERFARLFEHFVAQVLSTSG
jgi:DNA-binding MarR family transcriptional regulator